MFDDRAFQSEPELRPPVTNLPAAEPSDPDPLEFWDRREVLSHIRDVARGRRVGPWAVLGVLLVHALATVPPKVQLQAMIGGPGSLNLFLALVGPSGGGKGAAESAAPLAVRFLDNGADDCVPAPIPLGSGEGVARTFRPAGNAEPISAAVFSAPEVDTLSTLAGRQGATLGAELRKLFSGESLGFANSAAHTRCIVEPHTYRACLIAGVQPLRSRSLLDAADGGLPQRFVWLPVSDPNAPDHRPPTPAAWELSPLDWNRSSAAVELTLPDQVIHQIDAHRLAVLRGEPHADPLDGHLLLVRAKVAVGLAVLDRRRHVTLDDWDLAGCVMAVSAQQREVCRAALRDHSRKANVARAIEDDERGAAVVNRKEQRARDAVMRALNRHGQQTRRDLRRRLKIDIRDHFDSAIAALIDLGQVRELDAPKGGVAYTSTPVHRSEKPSSPGSLEGVPKDTGVPEVVDPEYTGAQRGVPTKSLQTAEMEEVYRRTGVPETTDAMCLCGTELIHEDSILRGLCAECALVVEPGPAKGDSKAAR